VYANIAACTPDKSGEPLKASGKFTRAKDRSGGEGSNQSSVNRNQGGYRRAQQPSGGEAEVGSEHAAVKIHVGKCKGLELRDLSVEQVQALVANWLPGAKANPKPLADDRRLMAALEWWEAEREKAEDNVPY
jgi:hypothetical protein